MRNRSTIFSLLLGVSICSGALSAGAQERRRTNDHDRNRNQWEYKESRNRDHDHDKRDHRDEYRNDRYSKNDRRDHVVRDRHHHHDRDHNYGREVRHIHYHDRYCGHRPVVVHHHYKKPRYIYFRDYDVYYDCHRNAYISYTGRSWTVSRAIPADMRYVNVRTTRSYEVDYYDDDFPSYLERRRPSCGQEYRGW